MPHVRECDVQEWLAFILKGRREQIIQDVGRLDIILDNNHGDDVVIIEVKRASGFLGAIGQVIGYTEALSQIETRNVTRVKIIALFEWEHLKQERRQFCEDICKTQNISVWWLDLTFLRFLYDLEMNQIDQGRDIKPRDFFIEQFRCKRARDASMSEFKKRLKQGHEKVDYEFIIESESDNADNADSGDESDASLEDARRQVANVSI